MGHFVKEGPSSVLVALKIALMRSWVLLGGINHKVQRRHLVKEPIAEGDFTVSLLRIAECFDVTIIVFISRLA